MMIYILLQSIAPLYSFIIHFIFYRDTMKVHAIFSTPLKEREEKRAKKEKKETSYFQLYVR